MLVLVAVVMGVRVSVLVRVAVADPVLDGEAVGTGMKSNSQVLRV